MMSDKYPGIYLKRTQLEPLKAFVEKYSIPCSPLTETKLSESAEGCYYWPNDVNVLYYGPDVWGSIDEGSMDELQAHILKDLGLDNDLGGMMKSYYSCVVDNDFIPAVERAVDMGNFKRTVEAFNIFENPRHGFGIFVFYDGVLHYMPTMDKLREHFDGTDGTRHYSDIEQLDNLSFLNRLYKFMPTEAEVCDSKHDSHYRKLLVQPALLRADLAIQLEDIPVERRIFVLDAVARICRAGNKEGEDWKTEIQKAINELSMSLADDLEEYLG
jgi:hypothetical protein